MKNTIKILSQVSLIFTVIFSCIYLYEELQQKQSKPYIDWDNHIAFMLDVSKSMRVADMDESSRLIAAKQKIFNIMSENLGHDFALSIFAWESQRVLPFTLDTSLFMTFLRSIDSNNITLQGTDIDAAMQDALESFGEHSTWNVIILTDGDESDIVISANTRELLDSSDTSISIIWIWTAMGGYIPTWDIFSPYKLYNWERIIVWLNESGLRKLAGDIGARYYNFNENIDFWLSSNNKNKPFNENMYILLAIMAWGIYIWTIWYTLYYAKN